MPSAYVSTVQSLLDGIGLTHDMAHLHGGLAIYLGVQLLLRTRRASAIALQAVIGAEMVNEVLEYGFYGSWRLPDTLHDIALTLFWPTALYLVAKYRRARWNSWMARRNTRRIARLQRPMARPMPEPSVPGLAVARVRTSSIKP